MKKEGPPQFSPEDLVRERDNQAERLISLGFHTALGYSSPQDYLASLPQFAPKSDAFAALGLNKPLLVEARLPLKSQCLLIKSFVGPRFLGFSRSNRLGLHEIDFSQISPDVKEWVEDPANRIWFADNSIVRDWEDDPRGFRTPQEPYTVWLQDGERDTNNNTIMIRSFEEIRQSMSEAERGGTLLEGVAYYIQHPEILRFYSISFPGTQVGKGKVPFLNMMADSVGVATIPISQTFPPAMTCGRTV